MPSDNPFYNLNRDMTEEQYYTAPSQEIFDDIKEAAIKIWQGYDDTYGYATGKVDRIKDISNVRDNYAYMVAMFDPPNTAKLQMTVKRKDTEDLIIRLRDATKY